MTTEATAATPAPTATPAAEPAPSFPPAPAVVDDSKLGEAKGSAPKDTTRQLIANLLAKNSGKPLPYPNAKAAERTLAAANDDAKKTAATAAEPADDDELVTAHSQPATAAKPAEAASTATTPAALAAEAKAAEPEKPQVDPRDEKVKALADIADEFDERPTLALRKALGLVLGIPHDSEDMTRRLSELLTETAGEMLGRVPKSRTPEQSERLMSKKLDKFKQELRAGEEAKAKAAEAEMYSRAHTFVSSEVTK